MNLARRLVLATAVAILGACNASPWDIEGTLDTVSAEHVVRVGLIGELSAPDRGRAAAYLGRLTRATGATPRLVNDAAEPLLAQLESGQLDLVIGEIARDSPWINDVAVIEPLSERPMGERQLGLSPIARNGENRWIMLLERLVRDQRGER